MWLPLAQIPNVTPEAFGNWTFGFLAFLAAIAAVLVILVQVKALRGTLAKGQEPVLNSDLDLAKQELEQRLAELAAKILPGDKLVHREEFDREVHRLGVEIRLVRKRGHKLANLLMPLASMAEVLKDIKERVDKLQTDSDEQSDSMIWQQAALERLLGEKVGPEEAVRARNKKPPKEHHPQ